jgi:hypothetical protein
MFNDENYHVIRNEGQHYHPDQHEYQKYLQLDINDSTVNKYFDLNEETMFRHISGDKFSHLFNHQKQYNENVNKWNYFTGIIHDITGTAPYITSLSLDNIGKFQEYNVYQDKENI